MGQEGSVSTIDGALTIDHGERPDRTQRGMLSNALESAMGHPMLRCYAVP